MLGTRPPWEDLGKHVPRGGSAWSEGPEAGTGLEGLGNRKNARGAGEKGARGERMQRTVGRKDWVTWGLVGPSKGLEYRLSVI